MVQRILLIDVDVCESDNNAIVQHYTHHPIGLLYLLSYTRQFYPDIDFKVFHTSTHNTPLQETEKLIKEFKPDLVGLRALSIAKEPFKLISQKIREINSEIFIVAGGPYPSGSYHEILSEDLANIVVIGEGEETFLEIITHLRTNHYIPKNIKGTAIFHNGEIMVNEPRPLIQNIDILPFPDYNYITLSQYQGIKNHALHDTDTSAFIMSSRGCPYGCFYCHQLFGKKIRRRSPQNVVAEMREHIDKRAIHDFVFLDDIFNVPPGKAKDLLNLISKELPNVRLYFPNGLRADMIDDEMLDLFEQAGTVEMALAVESVTPRLQKMMGKNLNIAKAEKAIAAASKRFITRIFFMIGFPTETFEEALDTIRFASTFHYAAQPTMSMLRLYNNTEILNILRPSEEQLRYIAEQEKKVIHLQMFGNIQFYGDFFPDDKVPLKSHDIKELLYIWMRDVLANPERIRKSHQILMKFLDHDKIIDFYRSIFNRPKFNEKELESLLKS